MNMLGHVYLGNPLSQWLLAVVAFSVTFTVLPLVRRFVMQRAHVIAGETPPPGVDLVLLLIRRTRWFFLVIVALYVAGRFLELPGRLDRLADVLIVVVFWWQVAVWGSAAAKQMLARRDSLQRSMQHVLTVVAQGAIYAIAVLLALDNLGVNITTLVAGLGIGGIAVALAVQTVLGDLLASLSITLDKPFSVGDLLRVDEIEGVVEFIGVRSTRLRSVTGEQIIIANADLLKSRVRNLGRMPERRTMLQLGIAYETPPEHLAAMSALVQRAVETVQGTRFEYCALRQFGESALQFEVVYFVPDWNLARWHFVAINDAVNRAIHAAIVAQGIRFAYPTRTVMLKP